MDNHKYISEVLQIADDLMELASNEDGLADEGHFGILLAVMRDSSYKLRRYAEHEGRKAKNAYLHLNTFSVIFALAALSILLASPVSATSIILSTDNTETLGGLTFGKDDLVEYDAQTDTATLYFDGTLLGGTADIDAAHVLDTGNIVLSTVAGASLGGLTFGKGDLIEYNPTTDTATLLLDESLFSSTQPNIDAAYLLDSGNIILSTTGNATLGGLSFGKDDLIEYNPTTDTASLFFDGNLFSGNEDVDAVNMLTSGNIVLSTVGGATLGGLNFGPGDLAEYNPITDVAILYFAESNFSGAANIDAVNITPLPEPATIALMGLGCLIFVGHKSR